VLKCDVIFSCFSRLFLKVRFLGFEQRDECISSIIKIILDAQFYSPYPPKKTTISICNSIGKSRFPSPPAINDLKEFRLIQWKFIEFSTRLNNSSHYNNH